MKNHGIDRECFIINEESVTPTHQQCFKFLGIMIGNAFRSKSCMPFNLVPMIWKQLADIQPSEADL